MLTLRPPKETSPEVLYRRLLAFRPSAPLRFQLRHVEHAPLVATALPASEILAAEDSAADSQKLAAVMARSLRASGSFAFDSHDDVLDLTDVEYRILANEFEQVFYEICPVIGRCDLSAWRDVLTKGASHWSNTSAVSMLGTCYESFPVGHRTRTLERPERYWGVAPNELLDGHLLVHSVARKIHESRFSSE